MPSPTKEERPRRFTIWQGKKGGALYVVDPVALFPNTKPHDYERIEVVEASPPERPRIKREEVAAKLEEMWLHDATGDPHDEGYMAALTEFSEWMKQMTRERGSAPPEHRLELSEKDWTLLTARFARGKSAMDWRAKDEERAWDKLQAALSPASTGVIYLEQGCVLDPA